MLDSLDDGQKLGIEVLLSLSYEWASHLSNKKWGRKTQQKFSSCLDIS